MDHLDVEGETQVGVVGEVDPQKTIPEKIPSKPKEKGKPGSRLVWLVPAFILALISLGALQYYQSQQELDGLRHLNRGLRSENDAKEKMIAALGKEVKGRDEMLLQTKAEASQFKNQMETMRLALMDRDGQILRLQQISDFRIKLPKKVRDLQTQLVQKQIENVSLQKMVSDQAEWLRTLSASSAKIVRMAGPREGGPVGGFVAFDPSKQAAVFYGFGLSRPPAGKVYQLWAIGNAPVSAGLFQPSGDRTALVKTPKLPTAEGIKQFSITVEPIGGSRQPTGPVTFSGTIGVSPS
ncbi:MAG: anti-sigma factor [Nitrospirae bacterium]|nr:anti-sigma factor [Candidatus Manganitrophaceae bacterium]